MTNFGRISAFFIALMLSFQGLAAQVKWTPGHYMMINSKDFLIGTNWFRGDVQATFESPNTAGIALSVKWAQIETARDVYNWDYIDAWMALAAQYDKQIMLRLVDRDFNTSLQSSIDSGYYPQYVMSEPTAVTATNPSGRCLAQKISGGVNNGSQFTFYLPGCRERMTKVISKMVERYNSHPNFEAYFHEETSLTMGASTDPLAQPANGNTAVNKRIAYFDLLTALKSKMPNTMYVFNLNYWQSDDAEIPNNPNKASDYLFDTTTTASGVTPSTAVGGNYDMLSWGHGGITFPDSMYNRPEYSTEGVWLMRKYRGAGLAAPTIAIAPQMQRANLRFGTHELYNAHLQDQYNLARDDYGATHILWVAEDDIVTIAAAETELSSIPCPTSFTAAGNVCVSAEDFTGGNPPPPPPPVTNTITSITPEIAASTANYIASGDGLANVFSATIATGGTSVNLTNVIGTDANSFVFDTPALTGITLDDYVITGTRAELVVRDRSPRDWTTAGMTGANDDTPYWVFTAARALHTVTTGVRATSPVEFTVTAGEEISIDLYVIGNANTFVNLRVHNKASIGTNVIASNASNVLMFVANNGLFSGTPTKTITSYRDGVVKHTVTGVAAISATMNVLLGTGTDTDNLIALGFDVWRNKSTTDTVTYTRTPTVAVTTPTLSNLNTDNVIDVNATNTLNGANHTGIDSITLSKGGADIAYPVIANPTAAISKWRVADLVALGADGPATLTANYGQPLYSSFDPSTWTENATDPVVGNGVSKMGIAQGYRLNSTGNIFTGFSVDDAFDVVAGRTVRMLFLHDLADSASLRIAVSNKTSGDYIDLVGPIGNLTSSSTSFCTTATITQHVYDNLPAIKIDCVVRSDGAVKWGMGPYTTEAGKGFIAYGAKFIEGPFADVSLSVTHPGGGTVENPLTKKFVWSTANGHAIECYNATTNTLTPFTGNMAVTITDGDYFTPGSTVNELAYDSSVAFSNGESTVGMIESNLESGSVNALLTGSQGYNYWATDGTCRADDAIELIAE